MLKEPSGWIFANAKQFYNLSKTALDDPELLQSNIMAVICNLALCVELLLKSMDAGVKKSPYQPGGLIGDAEIHSNAWGHDLEKIFNGLDYFIQTKTESSFNKTTNLDIRNNIAKCKDYFVHARYAHEPSSRHSYDITAIQALAEGLIKVIENWHDA